MKNINKSYKKCVTRIVWYLLGYPIKIDAFVGHCSGARQPLEIKQIIIDFLIQTMAKDRHVGSSQAESQPATASTGTLKQTAAEKRAAKQSAEAARSSVSA